jgi:sulfur carrier protein
MPEVVLNGESLRLPDGATVADAVHASGAPADGRGVAVAVDGEVVTRAAWSETVLSAGARVEVLQAVQGGR